MANVDEATCVFSMDRCHLSYVSQSYILTSTVTTFTTTLTFIQFLSFLLFHIFTSPLSPLLSFSPSLVLVYCTKVLFFYLYIYIYKGFTFKSSSTNVLVLLHCFCVQALSTNFVNNYKKTWVLQLHQSMTIIHVY